MNKKRPADTNQRAKLIAQIAIGDVREDKSEKNPHAMALGRMGGLKGGKARAQSLTAAERGKIAKAAAAERWSKHKLK